MADVHATPAGRSLAHAQYAAMKHTRSCGLLVRVAQLHCLKQQVVNLVGYHLHHAKFAEGAIWLCMLFATRLQHTRRVVAFQCKGCML
jgi:hypothetical protein